MKVTVLKLPVTEHMQFTTGSKPFRAVEEYVIEERVKERISVFAEETEIKNHAE